MKCKNCEWYDDDANTCNHPASPKSYEDVGPDDGCETGSSSNPSAREMYDAQMRVV